MVKLFVLLLIFCVVTTTSAQTIVLQREEVLKLPCKILKNKSGNYLAGLYNAKDSSLYNCRGVFKKTLPDGYLVTDTCSCGTVALKPVSKNACPVDYFQSIHFINGRPLLTDSAVKALVYNTEKLKASPLCGIKVVGYYADSANKNARQLDWDRVNMVINYLVDKQHLPLNSIVFSYENTGPANTMDFFPTTLPRPDSTNIKKAKPASIK